jgi:hypothetical protein
MNIAADSNEFLFDTHALISNVNTCARQEDVNKRGRFFCLNKTKQYDKSLVRACVRACVSARVYHR